MEDFNNVIKNYRDMLISARTIEEQKLDSFRKSITSVDPSVFDGIDIPDDFSLRAFCPEAYEDNPDVDKYEEQFNRMVSILQPINDRIRQLNSEALELVNRYKQLG